MTAKELIKFLSSVHPDTIVSVYGYEGGIADVKYARLTQVLLDVNDEDYYGPHEEDNEHARSYYGAASESAPRVLIYAGGR